MNVEQNCPIEVTPIDQSQLINTPQVISLNYTNQDFWSMKTRLVSFIKERFGPDGTVLPNTFNDFVESDIAIMLIENWAFLADTLSFKMDQIANEMFIDSVVEVDNAFRLSRLVGFIPQPPIAARALFSATINNTLTADLPLGFVKISAGTKTFELFPMDVNGNPIFNGEIIIPAGSTSNQNIIGVEGKTITDNLTGTGGVSQIFQLSQSSVIFDSIRVSVNGVPWQEVPYFTDSQQRQEYRVEFDSDWNAFVIFGNNRSGQIPAQGASVQITFRTGGGVDGNIVTGFSNTNIQVVVPGFSFTVPVAIQNYTKGEFGYDGDTIEDIRRKLPKWVRTQDRAVSGDDYKTITDQFASPYQGQVGKSTAVLRNHGCAGNIIDLYILAKEGANGLVPASSGLKVALNDEMNKKKMLTDFVCIKDGVPILTDVNIEITMDKFYRKFEQETRQNIIARMNTFFSLNMWEYGMSLKAADIIKGLSSIKNIDEIDVNLITSNPDNGGQIVTTRFYEIIRPDITTISFLYT